MLMRNVMRNGRGLLCCGMALGAALVLTSCDRIGRPESGGPKIEIEVEYFDMGEIESDEIAEDFIRVFNRGESNLIIAKVTTECNCTEGVMLDQVIPAGGEGVLRVTVHPSRIKGYDSTKTLTLFTNDPNTPKANIKISAVVKPGIVWEPKRLDFGEIPQGQGAEGRIRIRQKQNSPLEILGKIVGESRYVVAELVEIPPEERVAPDKVEYDLIVQILPETPVSTQVQNIILQTNARDGIVSFMAVARVVPPGEETASEDSGAPTDD